MGFNRAWRVMQGLVLSQQSRRLEPRGRLRTTSEPRVFFQQIYGIGCSWRMCKPTGSRRPALSGTGE